jgi:hypothetical protein
MSILAIFRRCFGADTSKPILNGRKSRHPASAVQTQNAEKVPQHVDHSSKSSLSTEVSQDHAAPTRNLALCIVDKYTWALSSDIPLPCIHKPDEVMVKVDSVGLNPIDWKSVDYNFCMPSFPWIGGREASGTIVEIGAGVSGFKVGDRVWTST